MDIIGNLPPEINEIVLKHLSAGDLWSCLSVSRSWRTHTNTNRLWLPHCKAIGINACDVAEEGSDISSEFTLCPFALEWKICRCTIVKWKSKGFKYLNLPSLSRPRFYSNNDYLVIIDDSQVVTVVSLRNSVSFFRFSLPSGIEFPDDVVTNDDHIIIICNNLGIIYKKDNLHSIFANTENQNILISTNNFSQFIKDYEVVTISCEFSFLCHNKFWGSYRVNDLLKHHVLIDIVTNEITVITPPLDTEVVEVIGINHRILFESVYEVLIYDADGRILFKKYVGEFCCASVNDYIVAIFKASSIVIFDIITGFKLNCFLNDCYLPRLFLFSNNKLILLTRRERKYEVIYMFNIATGGALWSFKVPIPYSCYNEKSLVDIYGTFLVLHVDGGDIYKNINLSIMYVLNIENGHLVYEEYYANVHYISKNCFVKDINPMKLFLV